MLLRVTLGYPLFEKLILIFIGTSFCNILEEFASPEEANMKTECFPAKATTEKGKRIEEIKIFGMAFQDLYSP